MTIHKIYDECPEPETEEPVLEWRTVVSPSFGSLYLQARSPGGSWRTVVAITPDGSLRRVSAVSLSIPGLNLDGDYRIKDISND